MVSPISLDALRVLDAIDRQGSFAAAADELFRVPSAITYSVQKLESDLGVVLFVREGRRSQLTAVGRLLLEQGRQILQATDQLTLQARAVASGWEVELVIAVETVIATAPLFGLLEQFYRLREPTQVRLSEEVLAGCWDALLSQRCDLAIGAAGEPPGSGIETLCLGELPFVLVAAPQHPLTQIPGPLSAETLAQFVNVVIADTARNLPLRSVGLLDGQRRLTVPNFAQKVAAIAAGAGIGALPRTRIAAELRAGTLVELPPPTPLVAAPLYLAWRRGSRGRALEWFRQALAQPELGAALLGLKPESTAP